MEEFNENAISDSYVNCDSYLEIVVPESLRRILTDPIKRSDDYSYYDAAAHRSVMINPIRYRIDEKILICLSMRIRFIRYLMTVLISS